MTDTALSPADLPAAFKAVLAGCSADEAAEWADTFEECAASARAAEKRKRRNGGGPQEKPPKDVTPPKKTGKGKPKAKRTVREAWKMPFPKVTGWVALGAILVAMMAFAGSQPLYGLVLALAVTSYLSLARAKRWTLAAGGMTAVYALLVATIGNFLGWLLGVAVVVVVILAFTGWPGKAEESEEESD